MESIQGYIIQAIKDAARKAVEQMIDEMGVDGVIDKIQSYPARIRTQQAALTQNQRRLDEAKLELETVKADIMAEINSEVNGQGKPVFSNEKAREAEFIRRAKVSPEYQQALAEYRSAEDAFNEAKFTLDQLYNEFSAQKSVLSALVAKINLLAGIQKI